MLETAEAPKNGHIRIRAYAPQNVVRSICISACSMGNKQEEPRAIVQKENYDVVVITETW